MWMVQREIVNVDFENLETIDGVRHEGNLSSIVEGVTGHELVIIHPMKC